VKSYQDLFILGVHSSLSLSAQKLMFGALNSIIELSVTKGNVGLPCMVKCMGYFIHMLHTQIQTETNAVALSSSGSVNSLSMLTNNLDISTSIDDTDFMALLSVKAIHAMLLGNTRLDIVRQTLSACVPLLSMVSDDLPKVLMLLCTRRASVSIFVTTLPLFHTLLQLFFPIQRVLIECFMQHIYLKSLFQLKCLLSDEMSIKKFKDTSTDYQRNYAVSNYDTEVIAVVISSLADLMSSPGFVSSLWMSFDCDASKPDIVMPLFDMLCYCSRFAFLAIPFEIDSLNELAALTLCSLMSSVECMKKQSDRLDENNHGQHEGDHFEIFPKYFSLCRDAKLILSEGCSRFTDKPSAGLAFLQKKGVLSSPLTSHSVARFLRLCPSLPKDAVGSFLGELGKDNPHHEADTQQFHADVLLAYVSSFKFAGQGLLNCMRIFLTAFRLPGEAQQIDRILVAFSNHCHSSCTEGINGILENSMVTYLLTFSIIMLQTDRHNPNIREDRKMTIEQFIKNNTNYGADINQTKPLPRDFLESIFFDISKYPIRTEKNDYEAIFLVTTWLEMQLSVSAEPCSMLMISTGYAEDLLSTFSSNGMFEGLISEDALRVQVAAVSSPEAAAADFLAGNTPRRALCISALLSARLAIVEANIFKSIWHKLVLCGFVPFIPAEVFREFDVVDSMTQICVPEMIGTGIDIILFSLKIGHEMQCLCAVDIIIILLSSICGSFGESVLPYLVSNLENSTILHIPPVPFGDAIANKVLFLNTLLDSTVARTALGTLLQIVSTHPGYLSDKSWTVYLHTLGLLRDCSLLPAESVEDPEADGF
jgi:hypothetical protein